MLLDMTERSPRPQDGPSRLRQYIVKHHESMRDFAAAEGFKYNSVRDWIGGRAKPGVAAAVQLSEATSGYVAPVHWTAPQAAE